MSPVICVFDTNVGQNLIRPSVPDQNLLDKLCQRDVPEIGSASKTRNAVYETIILHLGRGEAHTRVTFGVADILAVPLSLGTTLVGKFIKSIHLNERKIVTYRSVPVPILIVQEAKVRAKKYKSYSR